jgi:hypothetical protein
LLALGKHLNKETELLLLLLLWLYSYDPRTDFYMPEDQAYGTRARNGSWTGMVGMILRGEVQLATCMFSFHSDRMNVVNFFPPFWKSK